MDIAIVFGQLVLIAWLFVLALLGIVLIPLILGIAFVQKFFMGRKTTLVQPPTPLEFMSEINTPEDLFKNYEGSQDLKNYFENHYTGPTEEVYDYTGDLDKDANIVHLGERRQWTFPMPFSIGKGNI